MSNAKPTLDSLRDMIGSDVVYQGDSFQIIEILEDGPSVVLKAIHRGQLQANQYQETVRPAPDILTLPVFSSDGETTSAAFNDISPE